mmetsp:Transcript_15063/g.60511  ORF Transcript_15063/g.60511 Transcript_15063/m.60511 type:complete len:306 (-) Transcript_15063:224-1141(-)
MLLLLRGQRVWCCGSGVRRRTNGVGSHHRERELAARERGAPRAPRPTHSRRRGWWWSRDDARASSQDVLQHEGLVDADVAHLDEFVALDDLQRQVRQDVLHVDLHVLRLPRAEVRVRVVEVPRERRLARLDVGPRRALGEVLHDRPHDVLPRGVEVAAEKRPLARRVVGRAVAEAEFGGEADAVLAEPLVHVLALAARHDVERVLLVARQRREELRHDGGRRRELRERLDLRQRAVVVGDDEASRGGLVRAEHVRCWEPREVRQQRRVVADVAEFRDERPRPVARRVRRDVPVELGPAEFALDAG